MSETEHEYMKEEGVCSLCGGQYTHWGNNPEPLKAIEERCCDECNRNKVIPARISGMRNIRQGFGIKK